MVREKGTHTYDIILSYHSCSKCGYILESRTDYEYRMGKYYKDLECTRCGYHFTLKDDSEPTFGPLIN